MKIAFNRQIRHEPYGGGHQFLVAMVQSFRDLGHEIVFCPFTDDNVGVIFMMDPRSEHGEDHAGWIKNYKMDHPNTKVIHRINDTDIARGTNFLDKLNIAASDHVADHTVFISEWLKKYYISRGFDAKRNANTVIVNGCDQSIFHPLKDRVFKACTLNDKIRLVTHHWSPNFNKGFDLYSYIDHLLNDPLFYRSFEFSFIGRWSESVSRKNVRLVEPLYGEALGAELRKHDIYVTAARNEACGMHHIEAMSCGLPVIYHRDGGGVVEICARNGGIQYHDNFIHALLLMIVQHKQRSLLIDHNAMSSTNVFKSYINVLNNTKSMAYNHQIGG